MRAINSGAYRIFSTLRTITASIWFASRPKPRGTELNGFVSRATRKSLRIRVSRNEFDTLDTTGNHVLNRIATTAAHTNDLDLCALVELFNFNHFDAHFDLLQYCDIYRS